MAPLTWSTFFGTWELQPVWLAAVILVGGGYFVLWRRSAGSTVGTWRAVCFLAGLALTWVVVASAIAIYALSIFWMHMVMHLLLIMVVPALLVLGHPLTVLVEGVEPGRSERLRSLIASRPIGMLTHPLSGLVIYGTVVMGTHLSDFLDQVATQGWLVWGEQVLYLGSGFLFLLPLLGEEPLRRNPPYLIRLIILMAAGGPDTLVGVVLLQTNTVLYPKMMGAHPSWAPSAITDLHIGGAMMWAGGDGLMMAIGVALMITVVTSPTRQRRMTGGWLEDVRRAAMAGQIAQSGASGADTEAPGATPADTLDPDSDEAWEAYNRMLARLRERE
jgi:putative copper resistance protein D